MGNPGASRRSRRLARRKSARRRSNGDQGAATEYVDPLAFERDMWRADVDAGLLEKPGMFRNGIWLVGTFLGLVVFAAGLMFLTWRLVR